MSGLGKCVADRLVSQPYGRFGNRTVDQISVQIFARLWDRLWGLS